MDADHYCLMWNNFQTNFLSALGNLRTSQDLVDVTLMCEGRNIRAHKVILSACSSYFRDLFKEIPCKHPVIILKDVSHYDLTNLLQFMYQGEVLITQECLTSFLKTAELLQISGLAGVMSGARQTPGAESESPKSVIEKLNPEIKITIPSDIENDKRVDYVESTEPTQGCSYQNQVTIPIKTESEEGEYDSNMEMDIRDNNEQFDTLRWNEDSNLLEQTLIVERTSANLNRVINALERKVIDLNATVRRLQQNAGNMSNSEVALSSTDVHLPELPVQTIGDVLYLEDFISNKNNSTTLMKYLSTAGGKDVANATRRVWAKLLSDEAAAMVSWIGANDKLRLSSMRINDVVYAAVKVIFGHATEMEVTTATKCWVRRSMDRLKRKQKLPKAPDQNQIK